MDEEIKRLVEQLNKEPDVFTKARIVQFLNKEKNLPIVKLAKILSLKPAYICHLLRLLKLPEIVVDGYYSKIISLSHLMTISRLKRKEEMVAVYESVLSKNLSVKKTEELVREKLFQIKSYGERIDQETKRKIEEKFKKIDKEINVKIIQTRIQAKLTLTIRGSLEKTSGILRKIINC